MLRRLFCVVFRGHRFGAWDPIVQSGPLDVEPDDRVYLILGFMRQCRRCWFCDTCDTAPGCDIDALVAAARARDQEEWDDIDARMAHLEMVEEMTQVAEQWQAGSFRRWDELT